MMDMLATVVLLSVSVSVSEVVEAVQIQYSTKVQAFPPSDIRIAHKNE